MSSIASEVKLWEDLESLRVIRGWRKDNPGYIERVKWVEKQSKAMFKESKRNDKIHTVKAEHKDRAPPVVAKWSKAATFRLNGARDYPRALVKLTKALTDQDHPVCAPGTGFPALKQGRNGNSMGKNYISEHDENEEAYQFRVTCNGEEECAPPTHPPATPPAYAHVKCAVCRP